MERLEKIKELKGRRSDILRKAFVETNENGKKSVKRMPLDEKSKKELALVTKEYDELFATPPKNALIRKKFDLRNFAEPELQFDASFKDSLSRAITTHARELIEREVEYALEKKSNLVVFGASKEKQRRERKAKNKLEKLREQEEKLRAKRKSLESQLSG